MYILYVYMSVCVGESVSDVEYLMIPPHPCIPLPLAPTGPTMNAYYQKFVDQKKVLVLDHISLLVGCAGSVWFFASLVESTANAPIREITSASSGASGGSGVSHNSHSFILGVLFVGIGDAAGAVVGSSYGKWRWSKHSGV